MKLQLTRVVLGIHAWYWIHTTKTVLENTNSNFSIAHLRTIDRICIVSHTNSTHDYRRGDPLEDLWLKTKEQVDGEPSAAAYTLPHCSNIHTQRTRRAQRPIGAETRGRTSKKELVYPPPFPHSAASYTRVRFYDCSSRLIFFPPFLLRFVSLFAPVYHRCAFACVTSDRVCSGRTACMCGRQLSRACSGFRRSAKSIRRVEQTDRWRRIEEITFLDNHRAFVALAFYYNLSMLDWSSTNVVFSYILDLKT